MMPRGIVAAGTPRRASPEEAGFKT